jgi:hypothetical protein
MMSWCWVYEIFSGPPNYLNKTISFIDSSAVFGPNQYGRGKKGNPDEPEAQNDIPNNNIDRLSLIFALLRRDFSPPPFPYFVLMNLASLLRRAFYS